MRIYHRAQFASQFFPALNLKKYFIEKKFWKGRANSYFKTEVAATNRPGWAFSPGGSEVTETAYIYK